MDTRWKTLIAGGVAVASAFLSVGASAEHSVVKNQTPLARVKYGKILSAAAGGTVKNNTLLASRLMVRAECPRGSTVVSARVASVGGTTPWRGPSAKGRTRNPNRRGSQTETIAFSNVPLVTGSAMRAMCPSGKRETVYREVALELTAKCRSRTGIKKVSNQFPQYVRLDCEEESRPAISKVLSYRHECPTGYVIRGSRTRSKTSSVGYSNPMTCVKGNK